jgi:hypothetical protein
VAKNGRDAGRKTSAELVVAVGSKTFNNWFGFERGLWQRKTDSFESVPKRSVFGTSGYRFNPLCRSAKATLIQPKSYCI